MKLLEQHTGSERTFLLDFFFGLCVPVDFEVKVDKHRTSSDGSVLIFLSYYASLHSEEGESQKRSVNPVVGDF